ncbi:MAG: alpha/beta hydrolase, partial [Xanthobacteraceae bacterium]
RQLEAAPLSGTVVPLLLPGEQPAADARPVEVVVDGGALVNWAIGVTEMLGPELPALLDAMARGRTHDVVASIAASTAAHQGDLSWGLHNGVVCSEWVPYERAGSVLEQGRRAFPAFPDSVLAQAPQFPFLREICRVWRVTKAPAAQRAIARGDIPTLVIAGGYDAITSPRVAQAAAAPLAAATLVVIPGVGHFVVPKSACAQRVMASFLADPRAPDTDCVAALAPPPFKTRAP